ncbi:cytochrome P450 [Geodermatophilus sp. CPCC 205506]|uniref:cytochrome P450 n=1 Tax=Geodermatophilus sp. CPCC 205506 TaxID=2936596 RepID=UPI003EED3114
MSTLVGHNQAVIPDDVARSVILPSSYRDEAGIVHPALTWLRANMPFARAELEGYHPIWLATRHADIVEIEKTPKVFRSGLGEPYINSIVDTEFLKEMNEGRRGLDTLANMDAPEHTKIKNVTSAWFMPANVRTREESIRQIARASVEKFFSFDGECDFVNDIAVHYPLRVIMSLFGVPEKDEPIMLKLTQDMFGNSDPEQQRKDVPVTPDVAARAWRAAIMEFHSYFNQLAAARRAQPTDDLASIIANAKVDGEYLPDSFVNGYYIAIATAGHDTTSSTTVTAMQQLANHPDQFRAAQADPGLIPGLVDEALRWASPVKHFHRIVGEDTDFRGQHLEAGQSVMLMYPSANRDESVFDNPWDFDITRRPNKHIAFGYGPHQCIGQHVAKLEMRIFFEELLPRLKSFEVAGPVSYVEANFLSGPKTLPLRFTKA